MSRNVTRGGRVEMDGGSGGDFAGRGLGGQSRVEREGGITNRDRRSMLQITARVP